MLRRGLPRKAEGMKRRLFPVARCWLAVAFAVRMAADETPPGYERRPGSPDGIGKWYMGREIAHFMTHQGAAWLEREEREQEERPTQLLAALAPKPGAVIADIGAGSGYLAWRLGLLTAPGGRVIATDIQPEMLAILRTNVAAHGATNVFPVLATAEDTRLPTNAVDLAVFVDVYHECDYPFEIIQGVVRALKPGGRLVLVEYRGEDDAVPIKLLHKMTEAQVRKEMSAQALEWVGTDERLPRQHIFIFRKASGRQRQ